MTKLLSIDPSGNWEEGKGTSGICRMVDGVIMSLDEIKAINFDTPEDFWQAHLEEIAKHEEVVIEGFKLYNRTARTLINSQFETPQLIGVIRHYCRMNSIPLKVQYASEIKNRWSESVLIKIGVLEERSSHYVWNGEITNDHKRDALKHALHYWRYKS